jgi:hypothetical protein
MIFGGSMKRYVSLLAIFIVCSGFAAAQESHRFSLGLGLEGNINTRKGAAMGETLGFDYGINEMWAAGFKTGFSSNFGRIMVIEPEVYIRFYFIKLNRAAFFVQGDLGASLIFEDFKPHAAILGGLTTGLRISLGSWYVEPYIRGGYPFGAGGGFAAGYRF